MSEIFAIIFYFVLSGFMLWVNERYSETSRLAEVVLLVLALAILISTFGGRLIPWWVVPLIGVLVGFGAGVRIVWDRAMDWIVSGSV